jgi:hypothetical protein
MVRESYKWLLVPMQVARPGKGISDITWEHFQINPATINRMQEIEQILKDNELLIGDWAPIHLAKMLKTWFWKDDTPAVGALDIWHKTCAYLYLPRLLDSNVLRLDAGCRGRLARFLRPGLWPRGRALSGFPIRGIADDAYPRRLAPARRTQGSGSV